MHGPPIALLALALVLAAAATAGMAWEAGYHAVGSALGTGYALTRRSMPLAGAGAMMVFMSLALHWVGVSLETAVAMVIESSAPGTA